MTRTFTFTLILLVFVVACNNRPRHLAYNRLRAIDFIIETDPETAHDSLFLINTAEPDSDLYYAHDSFGNITESKTTPNNTAYAERVLTTEYDPKGRFEVKLTNALGHFSQNNVDQDLGVVNYTLDANNIRTDFSYDKFGQLLVSTTPLGYVQKVKRWSNGIAEAPANSVYFTYTESTGNPPEMEFFDRLGRSLRKVVPGLNGQNIYVDVIYNAKGQVEKTSEPYFVNQTVYWNRNDYDAVGRPIRQTYADDSYYTFQYSGLTTVTTDPLGQKDTRRKDQNGNLVESIDNKNGSVTYEYNISGNCTKVTGPRTTIEMKYDKYDRQTKLIDPDLGTVEYGYNAFGELVSQQDARGTVTFTYDKLGRVRDEIRSDVTITNTYDTKWKGALSQSVANNNISQVYGFDSYGRITETTENIQGKAYVMHTSYNAANKVDEITYPAGFRVRHEYTATGYLSKVFDAQQTSKTYWQANTANARGQIESFTLGNGLSTTVSHDPRKGYITGMLTPGIRSFSYTFNTVGNLTDRKDNQKNLTEHFDYDGLNRLWKVSHNGVLQQEIGYDAAGNISSKTGVGSSFVYEPGTNHLKTVSGSGYVPANWDEIQYSSFNKITFVRQGVNSLALTYGVNKERKKSVTVRNGVTETKYYAGSLYEEVYIGNEIRQINHIFAGGGAVAIFENRD